jgi:glucan biosynthesis protein
VKRKTNNQSTVVFKIKFARNIFRQKKILLQQNSNGRFLGFSGAKKLQTPTDISFLGLVYIRTHFKFTDYGMSKGRADLAS